MLARLLIRPNEHRSIRGSGRDRESQRLLAIK
jgi:hypothetical protein